MIGTVLLIDEVSPLSCAGLSSREKHTPWTLITLAVREAYQYMTSIQVLYLYLVLPPSRGGYPPLQPCSIS